MLALSGSGQTEPHGMGDSRRGSSVREWLEGARSVKGRGIEKIYKPLQDNFKILPVRESNPALSNHNRLAVELRDCCANGEHGDEYRLARYGHGKPMAHALLFAHIPWSRLQVGKLVPNRKLERQELRYAD